MRSVAIALGAIAASSGCVEAPSGEGDAPPGARAVAPGTSAATPALAPLSETAPPGVSIQSYTTGGTGCADADSLSVLIASDGTAFLVIFDQMNLDYPPGPPVQHLNCVANIKLKVPDGWRFSVEAATTRGYAYLSANQSARIESKYFFSGSPAGGMWPSDLAGPLDDDYTFTDDTTAAGWSKCGGQAIFHLHTKLTLNVVKNKAEPAFLNASTADAKLVKRLFWQWQPC